VNDRRVPEPASATEETYFCTYPGCDEVETSFERPICPIHNTPMETEAERRSDADPTAPDG
jgi:hypothetical protein